MIDRSNRLIDRDREEKKKRQLFWFRGKNWKEAGEFQKKKKRIISGKNELNYIAQPRNKAVLRVLGKTTRRTLDVADSCKAGMGRRTFLNEAALTKRFANPEASQVSVRGSSSARPLPAGADEFEVF